MGTGGAGAGLRGAGAARPTRGAHPWCSSPAGAACPCAAISSNGVSKLLLTMDFMSAMAGREFPVNCAAKAIEPVRQPDANSLGRGHHAARVNQFLGFWHSDAPGQEVKAVFVRDKVIRVS